MHHSDYALLGLMIGLLFGGLLGGLLFWATKQSGFLWLLAVGTGIGLWLGTLVDRSQYRH